MASRDLRWLDEYERHTVRDVRGCFFLIRDSCVSCLDFERNWPMNASKLSIPEPSKIYRTSFSWIRNPSNHLEFQGEISPKLSLRQHPTIVDYSSFGTLWPPQKLFARRSFLPKVRIAASCNLHCCFQQGKNPGYLVYILFIHGDCTTQLQKVSICFYYISHYEDPIMNQPVSHGML